MKNTFFSNKHLSWIFKITITVVFVVILNKSINYSQISIILGNLTYKHLGFALFFSVLGLFFQVKRWEIILRFQNFAVKNNIAWKTILWGNLLAFVTPGRIGEIFRGLKIDKNRKKDSLFAVIIDKLFIIFTILSSGFACLIYQLLIMKIGMNKKVMFFFMAAFIICLPVVFILTNGKLFQKNIPIFKYANKVIKNLPRLFTPAGKKTLFYSYMAHICLIIQTVILFNMFECGTVLSNCIALGQAYGIMLFFPLSIGNMGVREGAFTFFLTYFDTQCKNSILNIASVSLGVSMLILVMNIILPAMAGLVWYLGNNRYYQNRTI
ncbi:MAG: lysylphosphatidylglycerol synthase domain-containing protein [Chitinispirillia bacterium]|jgi:hypothetical protein